MPQRDTILEIIYKQDLIIYFWVVLFRPSNPNIFNFTYFVRICLKDLWRIFLEPYHWNPTISLEARQNIAKTIIRFSDMLNWWIWCRTIIQLLMSASTGPMVAIVLFLVRFFLSFFTVLIEIHFLAELSLDIF